MRAVRKIVEIDEERCDGCGLCVLSCAEGAIQIVEGKARLVSESYCDGLGACLGECPQGALRVIERESEEFDPEAVEEYLKQMGNQQPLHAPAAPAHGGCPSARIRTFEVVCDDSTSRGTGGASPSALSHWPVQLRLVPANAPFLKSADLLVAADCVPVAYPDFHRDFLAGKVVLIGCPKFDNPMEYVQKFAEIFKTADVKRVTVVDMEVPCCSALGMIVRKGLEVAGKSVPVEQVTVSTRGGILDSSRKIA
jgi:Pyruvate/2-oxoacid:ferredoxin oxidoreductase delta subunit